MAVTPDTPRALAAEELAQEAGRYAQQAKACSTLDAAIRGVQPMLDEDTALFCCGSLYLAAQARPLLFE